MIAIAFLVVSVIGALFTWNAFRPIVSPAPLATLSFFAGWLTSELPLHHVLWQLALTAGFLGAGALHAPLGWVGLGVCGLSWLGLVRLSRRSIEAEVVVERALQEGLGPDYRERVLTEQYPRLAPALAQSLLVLPFVPRAAGVEQIKNVLFHHVNGVNLRLDIHRPASKRPRCPVLIFVHGGAWMIGKKDHHGLYLMQYLAAQGWVCFGINYRLSPRATFPDHIIDVKRAIAWVREHAAEHGGDPAFVIIAGGSAGGHLCSLAALTPQDTSLQPGFEQADTRVSGCVSLYGIYDFEDRAGVWPHQGMRGLLERFVFKARLGDAREAFERASPIRRIEPDAPPFLVIHGDLDTMVPVEESRRFVAQLRSIATAPVCYAEIPGAQHAFEVFPSQRSARVYQGIARFGAFLHSQYLDRHSAPALAPASRVDAPLLAHASDDDADADDEAIRSVDRAARSSAGC